MTAAAKRRAREREARRESILDAAEALLARTGPRTLTMDDVAREATLSKGALYLYFPGKDALIAAVAERRLAAQLPDLRASAEGATTGLERLLELMNHFMKRFVNDPAIFRTMVEWLLEPRVDDLSEDFAAYRARVAEVFGLLFEAIERGKRDGSIRNDIDTMHQALQIWSSSLGVLLMHHNAEGMKKRVLVPLDFARLPELHTETIRRALANDGGAR
ncbi:MAG: helix-turn-helix transcriptional regulator [Myxococcales bacterium]|nr:helix-turn-helix transcriptional regulator [Myxococcales bacterium]